MIFILWKGGENVIGGLLTAGQLVAFLELYLQFVKRGFRVPQLINSVQAGVWRTVGCARCWLPPCPWRGSRLGHRSARATWPGCTATMAPPG